MSNLLDESTTEALNNSDSQLYLQYDATVYIQLNITDQSYVLYSEGFKSNYLKIDKKDSSLVDTNLCLFKILPAIPYKKRKHIQSLIDLPEIEQPENVCNELQSRLVSLNTENNCRYLDVQKLKGKFISFHSLVQFQHVISQKFLTFNDNEGVGLSEDSTLKLEVDPSENSLFQLLPSFKYQTEYQKFIRYDQEIYISNKAKDQQNLFFYINVDSEDFQKNQTDKIFINGSKKLKTKLEIKCMIPVLNETHIDNYLFFGNIVWSLHGEHLAYLIYNDSENNKENNVNTKSNTKNKTPEQSSENNAKRKSFGLKKGKETDEASNSKDVGKNAKEDLNEKSKYLHFQKMIDANQDDKDSFWKIEAEDNFHGGLIYYGAKIRFRHLISGQYLIITQKPKEKKSKEDNQSKLIISLESERTESSLFQIKNIISGTSKSKLSAEIPITIDSYMRFWHVNTNTWISIKKLYEHQFGVESSFEEKFLPSVGYQLIYQDMYKLQKITRLCQWETYMIFQNMPLLKYAIHFFENWDIQTIDIKQCQSIRDMFKNIVLFCYEPSTESSSSIIFHGLKINKKRQKLLSENNFIIYITLIIQNIFPSQEKLRAFKEEVANNNSNYNKYEELFFSLIRACYEILTCMLLENSANQLAAFEHISIYIQHIGYDLGALECVTAIIEDNERLQNLLGEPQANSQSVKDLIQEIILKSNLCKNREHLKLLKSICLCNRVPLLTNQISVMNMINLERMKEALTHNFEANQHEITVKSIKKNLGEIYENGVAKKEYSKISEEIFQEISLLIELCKGRNYFCRSIVTNNFCFKSSQNYLWNEELHLDVRACFAEALQYIHIDSRPRKKNEFDTNISTFVRELILQEARKKKNKESQNIFQQFKRGLSLGMFMKSDKSKGAHEQNENKGPAKFSEIGEEIDNSELLELNLKIMNYFEEFTKSCGSTFDSLAWKIIALSRSIVYFGCFNIASVKSPNKDLPRLLSCFMRILKEIDGSGFGSKNFLRLSTSSSKFLQNDFFSLPPKRGDNVVSFNEELVNTMFIKYINKKKLINLATYYKLNHQYTEVFSKIEILKIFKFVLKTNIMEYVSNYIKVYTVWSHEIIAKAKFDEKFEIFIQKSFIEKPTFLPVVGGGTGNITGDSIFDTMINIFLNSKYYKLKYLSLKVLFKCYQQRVDFIKTIKKYQLIFTNQEKDIFIFMKAEISKLVELCEDLQTWLTIETEKDVSKNNKLYKALLSINNMIYFLYTDVTYNETLNELELNKLCSSSKISFIRQKMLKNLKVPDVIIKILRDGMYVLEKINSKNSAQYEDVIKVFELCYRFLQLFVKQNKKLSSKLMIAPINFFIAQLNKYDVGQSQFFTFLFKNNVSSFKTYSKQLIKHFSKIILKNGKKYSYLAFLATTLAEFGVPNMSNQHQFINFFYDPSHICDYFYIKKVNDSYELDLQFPPANPHDQPYIYHAKLFSMLSLCIQNEDPQSNLLKNLTFQYIPLNSLFNILLADCIYSIRTPKYQSNNRIFFNSCLRHNTIKLLTNLHVPYYFHDLIRQSQNIMVWINNEINILETLSKDDITILADDGFHFFVDDEQLGLIENQNTKYISYNYPKYLIKYLFQFLDKLYDQINKADTENSDLITAIINFVHKIPKIFCLLNKYAIENPLYSKVILTLLNKGGITKDKLMHMLKVDEIDAGNTLYNYLTEINKSNDNVKFTIRSEEMSLPFQSSIIWEASDEGTINRKEEGLWKKTVLNLVINPKIKEEIIEERKRLLFLFNELKKVEPVLVQEFFSNLMNFIEYGISNDAMHSLCCSSLGLLNDFLSTEIAYDTERLSTQLLFNSTQVTQKTLGLLSKEYISFDLFSQGIQLLINLLDGGNKVVQDTIYSYFISRSESEIFFSKINSQIQIYLKNLKEIKSDYKTIAENMKQIPIVYSTESVSLQHILRLLQLLCEGHNTNLQNYVRNQTRSRISYNMISILVKLLEVLTSDFPKIKNYEIVIQCFDTLIEFVQGPCTENQLALVETKFLGVCSLILSNFSEDADKENLQSSSIESLSNIISKKFAGVSICFGHVVNNYLTKSTNFTLDRYKLALIKYKVSISLESLLERQQKSVIVRYMTREINLKKLIQNLIEIYQLNVKLYENNYEMASFNHHLQDKTTENAAENSLIIETGFKLFHILLVFMNVSFSEMQDQNIKNELNEINVRYLKAIKVEDTISAFFAKMINRNEMRAKYFDGGTKKNKIKNLKRIKNDPLSDEANTFVFFYTLTGEIEVVRDDMAEKIYFPILPYCLFFSRAMQESFHQEINRASIKTKISGLVEKSGEIILKLKREANLKIKYGRKLDLFTNHHRLWKDLTFYLMVIINFCIVVSLHLSNCSPDIDGKDENIHYLINCPESVEEKRLLKPTFLKFSWPYQLNSNQSYGLITLLILLHLITAITGLVVFSIKHFNVLLELSQKKFNFLMNHSKSNNMNTNFKKLIFHTREILRNLTFMYSVLYVWISLLAVIVSPLFICLLILDIVNRYPLLGHIIKSIWRPRNAIILTILMVVTFIYIFSIISFLFFKEEFQGRCKSLSICFWYSFDRIFKYDGGIGGYLYTLQNEDSDPSIIPILSPKRVAYDFFYNLLVLILLFEMMAGIIIDTFAILRDEETVKVNDMINICFICGVERNTIEKIPGKTFANHVDIEHNVSNYLFYIAYLEEKNINEYSGIESYVAEKLSRKDTSWFPSTEMMEEDKKINNQQNNLLGDDFQFIIQKTNNISDKIQSIYRSVNELGSQNSQISIKLKQKIEKDKQIDKYRFQYKSKN